MGSANHHIFLSLRALAALSLLLILSLSSCRDDFETSPSTGNLGFSKDTVFLDTVFSNIGSSTYTLKVYNHSDQAVSIPDVGLAQGENSKYRLNVNGVPGKTFENVEILARDSIFIFVETTFDIQDATAEDEYLYTDAIVFDQNVNEQRVALVTLVKDAIFLYPSRDAQGVKETLNLGMDASGEAVLIEGFVLDDDELTFTNDKPYVIYGYAAVAENKTMTVEAGARLHFHKNSGILVGNGGSLHLNGNLSTDPENQENEIIMQGDRLDPGFENVPGQWGTIWLTPGSVDNRIAYTTIKNATVGVLVDAQEASSATPDLILENTSLFNLSNIGLYCINSNVQAGNVVVNNAGVAAVALQLGGKYNFTHCTVANYTRQGLRNAPAFFVSNFLDSGDTRFIADLDLDVTNSIIAGDSGEELGFEFEVSQEVVTDFFFSNTALRFDDTFEQFSENPLYDFSDQNRYNNVQIARDFSFFDPSENNFIITPESSAVNLGTALGASRYPLDLLGTARDNNPDAGAYESREPPEEE